MQPFKNFTGVVAPMDRSNVDTDQVIPKQFLKAVVRSGLGKGLFFDWRDQPDKGYVLDHPRFMRMLTWEMAEGWQTFTQITARFPPEYTDQFEMLFQKARNIGLLRSDFLPVIQFTMLLQICQVYLVSLPLYQTLLPGLDLSEAHALAHAREYLADFVVAGIMGGS